MFVLKKINNLIPTININSLIKNDFASKKSIKIIKEIEKACLNIGFFQIVGHGINKKKIKNICDVGSKFFKSSRKNKIKLAPKKWNKKNNNVYIRDIKRFYLHYYKNRLILLDGLYDWEELVGEGISGGLVMFGTSHTVKKAVSSKSVELIYGSNGDMSWRVRGQRKARKTN